MEPPLTNSFGNFSVISPIRLLLVDDSQEL